MRLRTSPALCCCLVAFGLAVPGGVTASQDSPESSVSQYEVTEAVLGSEVASSFESSAATDAKPASLSIALSDAGAACDCGHLDCCSCEKQKALKKAVATAYKDPFYNNNFDYLSDPCYSDWHLGEHLKRMCFFDCIRVDVGGQYRVREQTERNFRIAPIPNRLGLTGYDDDFLMHRTRLYVNTQIGERVRVYGEMLDATSNFEDFGPRAIEENRTELQNLFMDLVVYEGAGKLTARVGRQELLYGSQRLVSPLDWANIRRTFEGGKLMWQGDDWDVDAFWVRPLRHYADQLDPPNMERQLYGLFSTYKGMERDKVDLYWLGEEDNQIGFHYQTLGSRYYGNYDAWLYDFEGGMQFGENRDDTDHSAGFFVLGLGRKFDCVRWKPTLWAYYDWASGDDTVGNGFYHYEPLAHRYLGFMDMFGRRNIEDANLQLTLQPTEKLTLLLWYHYFWLQNGRDVPYNVDMTAFNGLTSGQSGSRDLGHEIDCTASFPLATRLNCLLGYSHFFAGNFYKTSPVPYSGDANFFYTQMTLDF